MADEKLILVVDDDPDLVEAISMKLESRNYRVAKAYDGVEAWDKIKEERPELIILDVMMPKEGGLQIYRDLKQDRDLKHVPVIMLSTIDRKTFLRYQRGYRSRMGWDLPDPGAYLEKPLEAEELIELVRTLTKIDECPLAKDDD